MTNQKIVRGWDGLPRRGSSRGPVALPANSKTYRLVTDSNGTVEASSVLLTAADAVDMLAAEVLIHRLAGWRVSVSGEGLEVAINAERGESRRIVTVEEVISDEEREGRRLDELASREYDEYREAMREEN